MKKTLTFIVIIVSMVTIVLAKDPVPNTNYTQSLHYIILQVGDVKKTQYFVSSDVYLTENGKRFSIKYYRDGDFDKVDSRIKIGTGQRGAISRMDSTAAVKDNGEGEDIPSTYVIYVKFKKSNRCHEKGTIEVPFVYDAGRDVYVIKSEFQSGGNKYTTEEEATLQVSSETDDKFRSVGDIKIKNKDAPKR